MPKQIYFADNLTRHSARGQLEFSLQRFCRWQLLVNRANSICQTIARHQLDMSEAEFSHEVYYPMLALLIKRKAKTPDGRPMQQDEINRNADKLNDPYKIIPKLLSGEVQPYNRWHNQRRAILELFPPKIWVPTHQKDFVRWLSFHCCEYPHDNVDKEGKKNDRKRKLIVSNSLTLLAVPAPPEVQTTGSNTDDQQPCTSSQALLTDQNFTASSLGKPSENPPIERAASPY